jgi:quercetin dioxygenase-like cupin family protein
MDGVALRAGEGEALFGGRSVIKADFEELSITESLFPDARPGASPHFHRQHADSFYVLDGGNNRVSTIKIGREELSLVEFELEPGFAGPEPHGHDDHVDSFYVVDGEAEFLVGEEKLRLGAGSFVAAPIGLVHTFSNPGPGSARLINVHAPSCGFHDWLRENS